MKRSLLLLLMFMCLDLCAQNPDSLLRAIYASDQAVRKDLMRIYTQQPLSPDSIIAANARMQQVDAENQRIVFGMLDNDGWPGELTPDANMAICLVIDHAPAPDLKRYMPLVEEQAAAGVVPQSMYATMLDRMLMHDGLPQRYGTQTVSKRDADGSSANYVWPVEEADRLDAIRAEVGLPPLAEYLVILEQVGQKTVWNPELGIEDMPLTFGNAKRSDSE